MAISQEQYDILVEAFREKPGKVSHAAAAAGVSRPTARRAWTEGYPARGNIPERPAIGALLEAEELARQKEVRARLLSESEAAALKSEAREKKVEAAAREEVIQARQQEAELVRSLRANVLGLIATTGVIMEGALQKAPALAAAIRSGKDLDGKPLTARTQVDLLWKITRMVREAGTAAGDALRMERLLLGEPTDILGIRDLDAATPEEAVRELQEGAEAARRYTARQERRGHLALIHGGGEDSEAKAS